MSECIVLYRQLLSSNLACMAADPWVLGSSLGSVQFSQRGFLLRKSKIKQENKRIEKRVVVAQVIINNVPVLFRNYCTTYLHRISLNVDPVLFKLLSYKLQPVESDQVISKQKFNIHLTYNCGQLAICLHFHSTLETKDLDMLKCVISYDCSLSW